MQHIAPGAKIKAAGNRAHCLLAVPLSVLYISLLRTTMCSARHPPRCVFGAAEISSPAAVVYNRASSRFETCSGTHNVDSSAHSAGFAHSWRLTDFDYTPLVWILSTLNSFARFVAPLVVDGEDVSLRRVVIAI